MLKDPTMIEALKFKDYKDFLLEGMKGVERDGEYNAAFIKKALKQTFYGPYYSKTNAAFNFFTPVIAPIVLPIAAVAALVASMCFAAKSLINLCYDTKKEGQTRKGEALKSITAAGMLLALSIVTAILAVLSPLIALASVIGSSIATLAKKCSKDPVDPNLQFVM